MVLYLCVYVCCVLLLWIFYLYMENLIISRVQVPKTGIKYTNTQFTPCSHSTNMQGY